MLGLGAGVGGRGAGASTEGQKSTGIENYSTAAERSRSAAADCRLLARERGWRCRVQAAGRPRSLGCFLELLRGRGRAGRSRLLHRVIL